FLFFLLYKYLGSSVWLFRANGGWVGVYPAVVWGGWYFFFLVVLFSFFCFWPDCFFFLVFTVGPLVF
ncbi:hypothetical protein ACQWFX_24900, partial [Salmonella enterica subsp. enterica serovar Infantis]